MNETLKAVADEIEKVIVGKRPVIYKLLTAILAGGHVLLDDVPGVGKTSLAVALGKACGLRYRRVQFTPDVLPSDIVGFSAFQRETGTLRYVPGAVIGANLLLGDELNRTSSKTQSALLEAMEEGQVTVDGTVHPLERPFCVVATQNQVGGAGTQPLPQAQLDRFLLRLTVGYPDHESQMELLRDRELGDPMESVREAASAEDVLRMQAEVRRVTVKEALLDYITRLTEASREHERLRLGVSPRGALAVTRASKAWAYLMGRDYVIPEDVREVFAGVCAHRLLLDQRALQERVTEEAVCEDLLKKVKLPRTVL